MSEVASRFGDVLRAATSPPYITFVEGQPVIVVPLDDPEPYKQPGRGITRYRVRVAQLCADDKLRVRLITLPETATRHFTQAAVHGGFVSVVMQDTPDGVRYWSTAVDTDLTAEEKAFVAASQ